LGGAEEVSLVASHKWGNTKLPTLVAVGTLLLTAVGALLFVVSVYYVATQSNKILLVLGAITVVAAVVVLIRVGQEYEWTGFGESVQPKPENQEIRLRKTLWNWLELLSVLALPIVVAAAGFWFTAQQEERQQRIEEDRAEQAQQIENQRAAAERELAEQRAQDEALQAYLDQMSGLLLERDLRASEEDSEVRTLARARTLTVLSRLDPSRKTALIEFLIEADLVQRVDGREPIINLRGAGLRGAELLDAKDLSYANLSYANLRGSFLVGVDLSGADLGGTYLREANLYGANLRDADLVRASLSGANLRRADLSDADLSSARLMEANLSYADLRNAFLRSPILSDANLSYANLRGAEGISNEELEQQDVNLEGATMPDGQKYEDWIKEKEG
jgi:uncharacterized protein YjbI with pentapeptide repeats